MKPWLFVVLAASVLCACVPKSELEAANRQIQQLSSENGSLRAELAALKAKKPELPLSVKFRKAIMGDGLVAIIDTTEKKPLTVLATLKSKALGTSKSFELHLDSRIPKELSYSDGATIEFGDTLVFENSSHLPMTLVIEKREKED